MRECSFRKICWLNRWHLWKMWQPHLKAQKNERNFVEPINVCDSEWTNQIVLCIANFWCWFVFPSWTLSLFHLSTIRSWCVVITVEKLPIVFCSIHSSHFARTTSYFRRPLKHLIHELWEFWDFYWIGKTSKSCFDVNCHEETWNGSFLLVNCTPTNSCTDIGWHEKRKFSRHTICTLIASLHWTFALN